MLRTGVEAKQRRVDLMRNPRHRVPVRRIPGRKRPTDVGGRDAGIHVRVRDDVAGVVEVDEIVRADLCVDRDGDGGQRKGDEQDRDIGAAGDAGAAGFAAAGRLARVFFDMPTVSAEGYHPRYEPQPSRVASGISVEPAGRRRGVAGRVQRARVVDAGREWDSGIPADASSGARPAPLLEEFPRTPPS